MKNFCKILLSLIFATMFCLILPSCSGKAVIERSAVGEGWDYMIHGNKVVTVASYDLFSGGYIGNQTTEKGFVTAITAYMNKLEKHIVKEVDKSITDSLSRKGCLDLLDFETDHSFLSLSSTLLSFPSKSHALSIEFYDGYVVIGAYATIEEYITDENKTTPSLNGDTICFSLDNKAEEIINNLIEITGRN